MFNERPMPFYMSYPLPFEKESGEQEEREWGILRSWYSQELLRAQEIVERVCDELDYEGSWIYDEYPDRGRMEQTQRRIQEELDRQEGKAVEAEGKEKRKAQDFLCVLWYQELFRRRCRRKKCRRCF